MKPDGMFDALIPIDWFLIGGVALFAAKGLWRGFIREAFGLAALALGVTVCLLFGELVAQQLVQRFAMKIELARVAGYAGCFLVPYVAAQLLAYLLHKASDALFLGGINRITGACFGVVSGAVIAGAALAVITHLGWEGSLLNGSKIALPLQQLFHIVLQSAAGLWQR